MTEEQIIAIGFQKWGSCHCHGGMTRKYKKGLFMLYVGAGRFHMRKNGATIKSKTDVEDLQKYLQTVFITEQIQDSTSV